MRSTVANIEVVTFVELNKLRGDTRWHTRVHLITRVCQKPDSEVSCGEVQTN
jgi:hypothetical protein